MYQSPYLTAAAASQHAAATGSPAGLVSLPPSHLSLAAAASQFYEYQNAAAAAAAAAAAVSQQYPSQYANGFESYPYSSPGSAAAGRDSNC